MSENEMSNDKPSDSSSPTDKTVHGLSEAGNVQSILLMILNRLDSMENAINDLGRRVSTLENPQLKRDSWQGCAYHGISTIEKFGYSVVCRYGYESG